MADDNIDALVDEWGQEDVAAAFWLQQHIKDTGLEGIEYMEAARNHLRSRSNIIVGSTMKGEMDDNY